MGRGVLGGIFVGRQRINKAKKYSGKQIHIPASFDSTTLKDVFPPCRPPRSFPILRNLINLSASPTLFPKQVQWPCTILDDVLNYSILLLLPDPLP